MIELFERDMKTAEYKSSKGNQLKWINGSEWYKADYTGYEGLAEYVVSHLLIESSLNDSEIIIYQTEEILYRHTEYLGCRSNNFLPEGWQLITLERLFQSAYNERLNKCIYTINDKEQRLKFLVEQTQRITGLKDFGIYMSKLLTIDAIFLNEDRHTHNIAVLIDNDGTYHYCPYFDHGASLLSDTTMDYPLKENVYDLMNEVKSKTFSTDFDEQLDIAEKLYGQHLHFNFNHKKIKQLLDEEKYYPAEVKERVEEVLRQQMRKYMYLF